MRRIRTDLCGLLLVTMVMTLAYARDVKGAFTQATCVTTGWDTAVPARIGASEYIKQSTSPPGGSGDMTLYNFATAEHWPVYANSNVSFLKGSFGYFVTETFYDSLTVKQQNGTIYTYSGTKNSSQTALVTIPDDWSLAGGGGPIDVAWNSDISIAGTLPPNIPQVAPRCKTTQSSTAGLNYAMSNNRRFDGVLIKTGDTIYWLASQPANRAMLIRMDALAPTASTDFDLYVSTTTSKPDDSNFQWRGFHSPSTGGWSEALLIPASSSVRNLYIGVHSYSGAGQFALSADVTTKVPTNICTADASGVKKTFNSTQLNSRT